MNRKQQLAEKINALISDRDSLGAEVQGQIDALFAQFESLCDFGHDAIHAAHADAVARTH
jgi:hypothetical protein